MGPFPPDAPPAKISAENPAGTDGFEFVEFAHPRAGLAQDAVRADGFRACRVAQIPRDRSVPPGRGQLHPQRRPDKLRRQMMGAMSLRGASRQLLRCTSSAAIEGKTDFSWTSASRARARS